MIVFDTCVLSEAFRRPTKGEGSTATGLAVRTLIEDDWPTAIPGIVLQEILSGVRDARNKARLKKALSGFPLLLALRMDHEHAAEISNGCRRKGVSPSAVDCLIAAQTIAARAKLFTTDEDFQRIAKYSDLKLFRVEDLGLAKAFGD